jgi:hypothetical protein
MATVKDALGIVGYGVRLTNKIESEICEIHNTENP